MKHLIKTLILILIPFISFSQSLGKSGGKTRIAPTTQIRKGTKPRQVLMTRASDSSLVYTDLDTIIKDTDIKLLFSVVNDSIRIDSFDNKLGGIVGSPQFIDDVINKPQNVYKKCDGTDLLNGDKVYQVQNLTRKTGYGVSKLDGDDCFGNNDDYYNSGQSSYAASKTHSGNNFANGVYSRVLNGYQITLNGARSIGSGYGNVENGSDNAVFGKNNSYSGTAIIGGGAGNSLTSTLYSGGAYVNGTANTGIGGHGSILSGQECTGSFRGWVGGYLNKDLNSLWDNVLHGGQGTFDNTKTSLAHAQGYSIKNSEKTTTLASYLADINHSSQSGIFGGQLAKLDYVINSFILGGAQNNELKGTNSNMLESSIIIGGEANKIFYSNYTTAIGRGNEATKSDVAYLQMIGSGNKGIYGFGGVLIGNNLKATNCKFTGTGNYGLQWANGSKDSYSQNDVNWMVGCGFDESSKFNAITMLKSGWINFNTTAPSTSGVVQSQSAATPRACFDVNTINQSGNADGGVLLAPMTSSQVLTIPSGNLVDGLELYCTDCTANDSTTGVKMVYQLSTSTWRKLW